MKHESRLFITKVCCSPAEPAFTTNDGDASGDGASPNGDDAIPSDGGASPSGGGANGAPIALLRA